MNNTLSNGSLPFREYYDNLSAENPQITFRDRVIKECGITYPTFYKWLGGMPVRAIFREKIQQIAREISGQEIELVFEENNTES